MSHIIINPSRFNRGSNKPVKRLTGVIHKYIVERGFGFIQVEGEDEMYFFHFSKFISEEDKEQLTKNAVGLTVEFTPNNYGKHGPRAFSLVIKKTTESVVENEKPRANDEKFFELRVKSITSPKALAGSIVAHVMGGKQVKLTAIGHGAVAQAIKAVPIASGYTIPNGFILAIVPSFDVKPMEPKEDAPDLPEGEVMERTLMIMQLVKVRPY